MSFPDSAVRLSSTVQPKGMSMDHVDSRGNPRMRERTARMTPTWVTTTAVE